MPQSTKAYEEVRRFETTLYGALFRGQSKKRQPYARSYGVPLRIATAQNQMEKALPFQSAELLQNLHNTGRGWGRPVLHG